jgi:glucan phosphoethanolaminetransferase (alkaline phosphatase superfamily)
VSTGDQGQRPAQSDHDDTRGTDAHGPDAHGPDAHGPATGHRPVSWTNRLIIGFAVVVSLVAGWFIAVSFLPRWWAQRVGQVSDGSFTAGVFSGLTCGVVFTAVPLLLLRPVVRRRARWGTRLTFLVLAALAAVPNLTTLGIVLGSGNAAHAGERIMDVDAPGFRGATLVGAVVGAAAVVVLWVLLWSRRRRRLEVARLREELRRREAAGEETTPHD